MTRIAVAPATLPAMHEALVDAVHAGGGEVVAPGEADGLIWADPHAADSYPQVIAEAPHVQWIQLPYAGVEPFVDHLDRDHLWTCGKGVYAPAVAEWVMAALLCVFRDFHRFVRATSWPPQTGRNLLGARITTLGGGGITESLLELLEPWGCEVTVLRRHDEPVPGAARTLTTDRREEAVADADAVIVCLALTDETRGIVDADLLAAMPDAAWLVNVARGGHVVNADLTAALDAGTIAGAVLDVTEPEPLPDDHPLWGYDNVVITPHVGNTPEMGLPLLAARVEENVRRWLAGQELLGTVDVEAGY